MSPSMLKTLPAFLFAAAAAFSQQTSVPTALPSQPFVIRNTWFIGGQGSWNTLRLDAQAKLLFIAHEKNVQVVDVSDGAVAGTIGGFQDARDIALDPAGANGYVSDGGRASVTVFDRDSFATLAQIPTEPSPSSLVLEPQTGMLFVLGSVPAGTGAAPPPDHGRSPTTPPAATSSITVIDPQTRSAIGAILLSERLGAAQADGAGAIYVVSPGGTGLLRFDAQSAINELRQQQPSPAKTSKASTPAFPTVDWTNPISDPAVEGQLRAFPLHGRCPGPAGIALDSTDQRIFVACSNMTLVVLNSATGDTVTTLQVGPGAHDVGWDAEHGYIFVANGGGDGNITVIHRNVTDTYNVNQTLPTRQRARTMAVDADSGLVYLVTDYLGAQTGGHGGLNGLKVVPVEGSFQVLQIGQ